MHILIHYIIFTQHICNMNIYTGHTTHTGTATYMLTILYTCRTMYAHDTHAHKLISFPHQPFCLPRLFHLAGLPATGVNLVCGLPQPSHGTTESSAASLLTGAAELAFAPELHLTPLLRAFLSWQWVGAGRPSLFSCTWRFKARSTLLRLLCCGPGFPDMGYFILASRLSISHVVIPGHTDGGCACFLAALCPSVPALWCCGRLCFILCGLSAQRMGNAGEDVSQVRSVKAWELEWPEANALFSCCSETYF